MDETVSWSMIICYHQEEVASRTIAPKDKDMAGPSDSAADYGKAVQMSDTMDLMLTVLYHWRWAQTGLNSSAKGGKER